MKPFQSPRLRWSLAALLPVLLFATIKHICDNSPGAACAALRAALRSKDRAAIRQLTTPQGLAEMHSLANRRRSDEFDLPKDWLDKWQAWADTTVGDKEDYGHFSNPERTTWAWFAANRKQGIQNNLRLVWLWTPQGWKLSSVELPGGEVTGRFRWS